MTASGRPQTNIRRKKFIKNLVDGMGVGESAIKAGYSDKSEGSVLLRDPRVLTALQTAMERAGITDEYLSTKIKEGLEASYPEKRAKDGSVLQASAPDFFTRQMYLDKALKVRGDYAPERSIQEQRTLTINVNMEMARGLIDCGVITPEDITRIDDGREGSENRHLIGTQAEGSGQEDSGEREATGPEEGGIDQLHDQGTVPETAER